MAEAADFEKRVEAWVPEKRLLLNQNYASS